MNHERAQELILDLAYGELAPGEARDVERHVAECSECAAEWARIANTRRASARLADGRSHDHRRDAILAAARQAVVAPPQPRRSRAKMWTVGAGMAVAVLVGGVTLKLTGGRPIDRVSSVAPAGEVREPAKDAAAPAPDASSPVQTPPAAPPHGRAEQLSRNDRPQPAAKRAEAVDSKAERHEVASTATGAARRDAEPGTLAGAARETDPRPADAPAERKPASAAPRSDSLLAEAQRAPRKSEDEARESAGGARGDAPAAAPAPPDSPAAPRDARAAAAPGRELALRSRVSAASERAAASRAVVAAVETLLAGGELEETSRALTCGVDSLQQRSWADGGRIVKVAVAATDGTTVEGWYDREGRLRALQGKSGGSEPASHLRRDLDEHGAVVDEERRGSLTRDVTPWIPQRDPGRAPAEGCRWR